MQVSRSVAPRRLFGRTAVCASLLAACLQAGAASALSFTFSFSGFGAPANPATVTGIVDGLIDNTNNQASGITVTITSATNGPQDTVFTFSDLEGGEGFDVASGQVTGVNIFYLKDGIELYLGNQDDYVPAYTDNLTFNNFDGNSAIVFTPSGPGPAPVPGPLPIFGAAAAFTCSRRLRRRIKTTV